LLFFKLLQCFFHCHPPSCKHSHGREENQRRRSSISAVEVSSNKCSDSPQTRDRYTAPAVHRVRRLAVQTKVMFRGVVVYCCWFLLLVRSLKLSSNSSQGVV
jgi:hypothetical protein